MSLHAGEVHALVGQNGSGKSTLARCLSGAHHPDEGVLLREGETVEFRDPAAARRLRVATFHQEFSLVPSLSVKENIFLGRLPTRAGLVDWRSADEQSRETLAKLSLVIDPDRAVETLSVAEQQLVEIAKAISSEMSLLILDEPTAALGTNEVDRLHQVVRLLAPTAAVLYISHRLDEVLAVADVITVIRDGRIIGERRRGQVSLTEVAHMMVGRELAEYFVVRRAPERRGEPVFEARGISTDAGVDNVTLTVHQGEVLGLGGLIGSGRTEIVRALFGVDRLTAGQLRLGGRRRRLRSPTDAIKAGIGLVTEDRKADGLFFNLVSPMNVTIPRLHAISRGPLLALARERRQARPLMSQVGLPPHANELGPLLLSGGNQQKLLLARWLFAEARVLLLDEPTHGVDVAAKHEVYRLINDLTDNGMAVVLVSSDYAELLSMSDRVAVIRDGRVGRIADHGDLTQQQLVELASGGDLEAAP